MPSDMFSAIEPIELTTSAAIVVATLSFALARTGRGRLRAAAAFGAWFAVVVTLGATGALGAVQGIGTPGLGLAVTLPILGLCLVLFRLPSARAAIAAIPLPALIAVNTVRVLGFSFILLYVAGRLPAPFAPLAGWGDLFVGLTAGPVAWLVAKHGERVRPLLLGWNLIGLLDLVTAIGLGATSAPGPLQLFRGPPDSGMMVTLPWIFIPGFIVPSLVACHIAIFHRLGRRQAVTRLPASAGPLHPIW